MIIYFFLPDCNCIVKNFFYCHNKKVKKPIASPLWRAPMLSIAITRGCHEYLKTPFTQHLGHILSVMTFFYGTLAIINITVML
jgi:hypothetical protein